MKLKNLFFATMAFGLLTACSNDDDVNGPATQGGVDASISFVATANDLTTKATEAGQPSEDRIEKLSLYIFKTTGEFVNKKDTTAVSGGTVNTIGHVVVKVNAANADDATTDQFVAYLLANCKDMPVNNITDFEAAVATNGIETYVYSTTVLPMAKKIQITGLKPLKGTNGEVENWIDNVATNKIVYGIHNGATPSAYNKVVLERLIARVQVDKLVIDLSKISGTAEFRLDTLALANVHTSAKVTGLVVNANEFAKGYQGYFYQQQDGVVAPLATPYILTLPVLRSGFTNSFEKNHTYEWTSNTGRFTAYAFANDGTGTFKLEADNKLGKTLLLISGMYKASSTSIAELKTFRVIINNGDIKPNYIYKLVVTITGEGSPNEDDQQLNAHVSAQVTVAPWNVINQTEEDVN